MAYNVKPTTQSTVVKQQKPPRPVFAPTVRQPITANIPLVSLTGGGALTLGASSGGYTQRVYSAVPKPVKTPKPKPPSAYPGTQRTYYPAQVDDKVLGKLAAFQEKTPDKTLDKTLGDTGLTRGQLGDAARYTAQAIAENKFPNLMSPVLANMMGLTEAERVSLGYNTDWPYNRVDPNNGGGGDGGGGGGGGGFGSGRGGSGFGGALSRGEAFFVGTYNWRIGP